MISQRYWNIVVKKKDIPQLLSLTRIVSKNTIFKNNYNI
jgi:hypothetical protein